MEKETEQLIFDKLDKIEAKQISQDRILLKILGSFRKLDKIEVVQAAQTGLHYEGQKISVGIMAVLSTMLQELTEEEDSGEMLVSLKALASQIEKVEALAQA